MPAPVTVAIVGLGSRGLSVLERVVTLAGLAGPAGGRVRVELIDPRGDGAGVHATDQPDYLLLNTTCSQVSMFPDPGSVGDRTGAPGPTLYDWVTARGLRLAEDGFTVGTTGRAIRATDFLPRRVLGEYLHWFLQELRRRCPEHVELRSHHTEAVDLTDTADDRLQLTLATGARVDADHAFLTTGYTPNRPYPTGRPGAERLITAPYPLPGQLAAVRPGETVAISGFGLSAMDVMSCLTVGRGGRFVYDGDECRYLPSGREPRLLFYSRSGLACRARPQVARFDHRYEPVVFTPQMIDAQRAGHGGRLDFARDVLPLVLAELRVAYRRQEAALADPAAQAALEQALADASSHPAGVAGTPGGAVPGEPADRLAAVTAVLDRLDTTHGRFDAEAAFDPAAGMLRGDRHSYQKWLAESVTADLAEGRRGLSGSPLKAALDVLRGLRDTFRHTVDFGGLTDESLADFHARIVPILNRAVVGPQYERHVELLALLADGTAATPFGTAPEVSWDESAGRWTVSSTALDTPHRQQVDWRCTGNVALPAVAESDSPLLRGLYERGRIRPALPGNRHVPGIDVDRDQHPRRADGASEPRLWVLGPLCEATTFYNNLVPSPGGFSRPVHDAHRCVAAILGSG